MEEATKGMSDKEKEKYGMEYLEAFIKCSSDLK